MLKFRTKFLRVLSVQGYQATDNVCKTAPRFTIGIADKETAGTIK